VLRRALLHEHHLDLEKWEQRLGQLLRPESRTAPAAQSELFH
jgi:hypothetical protein